MLMVLTIECLNGLQKSIYDTFIDGDVLCLFCFDKDVYTAVCTTNLTLQTCRQISCKIIIAKVILLQLDV